MNRHPAPNDPETRARRRSTIVALAHSILARADCANTPAEYRAMNRAARAIIRQVAYLNTPDEPVR